MCFIFLFLFLNIWWSSKYSKSACLLSLADFFLSLLFLLIPASKLFSQNHHSNFIQYWEGVASIMLQKIESRSQIQIPAKTRVKDMNQLRPEWKTWINFNRKRNWGPNSKSYDHNYFFLLISYFKNEQVKWHKKWNQWSEFKFWSRLF